MKRIRFPLAVLLAWTLCFQAVAGVSDTRCKHASPMPHGDHAMHAGHAPRMTMHGNAAAAICGCGPACSCAGPCTLPCTGIVGSYAAAFAFPRFIPAVRTEPLDVSAGYGLDLLRPPSIS
jgi:hypothetical protein